MKTSIFKFRGIPPSYNRHFKINYNFHQIYLTSEARAFKKHIKCNTTPSIFNERDQLYLTVWYYHDWYYKNGKLRKLDLQNLDKLLYDAIFEQLGLDDAQIWGREEFKVQSTRSYTVVVIKSFN